MGWNKAQRRISDWPCDVYRVYDRDGALLYVGATVNVFKRMREHKRYARWWPLADEASVTTYEDRTMARHVEAVAIRDERPRFNVTRELSEECPRDVSDPTDQMTLWWDDSGEVWVDAA